MIPVLDPDPESDFHYFQTFWDSDPEKVESYTSNVHIDVSLLSNSLWLYTV